MAASSENGWSANDRSCIASYSLPGGKVALRKGDVSVVLLWCAQRWHETVEPLVWPGIWGYAERNIRGNATTLSNHASGSAVDLNAPRHPLGRRGTFSPAQVVAIRLILNHCEGVVRWGGDYTSRPDEMHLEINAGSAAVRRVADKIRGGSSATPSPRPRRSAPEENNVPSIPLPLDAARTFQVAVGAEAGGGSMVASRGFVTFGSTFGGTSWSVTALAHDNRALKQWGSKTDGMLRTSNNTNVAVELPPGTRCLTFEGAADNDGTRPWASYWLLP